MSGLIKKLGEIMRHNQFLATALIIGAVVIVWAYGCASTTESPWQPDVKLTREELNAEIDMINTKITAAYADLDKQDLFKEELFRNLSVVAEGGTVNPVGVGLGLLAVLGLGSVADNRKKDSVIKTMKSERTNGNATSAV